MGAPETAVAEYSITEAALAELRERHGNAVFDLRTVAGNKAARAARQELVALRSNLEQKRKDLKQPVLELGKRIDDEAKRITAEILKLEKPIDEQIKADEQRRDAERKAREEEEARRAEEARLHAQQEAKRISAIQMRIADLNTYVVATTGKSSAEIDEILDELQSMDMTTFEEFQGRADVVRLGVVAALVTIKDAAEKNEAEQARLKAEREEQERVMREQREAEERVLAERRAAQEAEMQAQREADAAKRKAEDEERARLRAEEEARDAAARKTREAEVAAERAAQEKRRAELEAQQRAWELERSLVHSKARRQFADECFKEIFQSISGSGISMQEICNAVCEGLPEGYRIDIELERNSGTVRLFDPEGDEQTPGFCADDDDESIAHEVINALASARAMEFQPEIY